MRGAHRRIDYRDAVKRIERGALIGAPPAEVFAFLADLEKLPEWQAGVTRAERTSPGEMAAGATAVIVRDVMGKPVEAPLTVTHYEPPRRFAIGSEISGVRAHATLDFEPMDDGQSTALRFAMEIRGSMLTSFMEPMIAGAAGGEIDASLERIGRRFAR